MLKAVEKHPADRYPTAQQLADDLRRFLNDQPIQARRPSLVQRAAKWSRRHRSGVIGATVTLIIALTLSTLVCAYAYHVAVTERQRADQQKAEAQENLQVAIRAVDNMYQGVASQWLASDTRMTATQEHFLSEALAVYEHMARQMEPDPEQREVVASACWRAAGIYHYLNDRVRAERSLDRAITLYEQLVDEAPERTEYRTALADCLTNRAILLTALGNHAEALQSLDAARQHVQVLLYQAPENPKYQGDLATNDLNRGETLSAAGRLQEAEVFLRRAWDQLSELSQPEDSAPGGLAQMGGKRQRRSQRYSGT